MSRYNGDVVEFTFADCDKNKVAMVKAGMAAFGINSYNLNQIYGRHGRIRCRPDQFARFLIYRSREVDNNGFRQFDAELISPRKCSNPHDVTNWRMDLCTHDANYRDGCNE